VVVAALTVAAVLPPAPANAEPGPASGATPDSVTLITGDRVELSPTGSPMVIPAAGREAMQYRITGEDGNVRVIPLDAVPLLVDGVLDPRLFDVTALRDAGYADAANPDLGLIVRHGDGVARSAPALREEQALPDVDLAAARVSKVDTATLWESLTAGKSGLTKVWLNGRRELSLEHSVPQIGAPAAWQAGYTGAGTTIAVVDSGIDATHPDLAGRVSEAVNFTATPDGDQFGHGTHVASIAAAVAPDARIVDAKACTPGSCTEAQIVAAMAWAAPRAQVVNMSLSGPDFPEIDPVEAAVNELSAAHGTLFVASAGNGGPVRSPATADAALGVGAVDRTDAVAGFSSYGPRISDLAIKPDLAAPGVDIVAAQAAGTEMGQPTGDGHVAASGTSMSAPHVAGAVAVLRQRHPDWTGERLKAALMGSAEPVGEVFQTGAGRVDVARAVTQDVTASPPSVSFGLAMWPHEDDQVSSQKVTYRNDGPAEVVLDVAAPAPFTVTPATVTLPAGGTADVTVSVDTKPASVSIGTHTGQVVATGAGVAVTTPVAVDKEDERYSLTLTHIGRDGNAPPLHSTYLEGVGDCPEIFCSLNTYGAGPTSTLRVPPGEYVLGNSSTVNGFDQDSAFLFHPKLVVNGDVALTLDARDAKPVEVTAPRGQAQNVRLTIGYDLRRDNVIGTNLLTTGWQLPTLHVGQVPGSPAGSVHSLVNATFAEPGPAGDFTDSPYVYHVGSAQDGMLDGVRLAPAQRDFAKVEQSYGTVSAASRDALMYHLSGSPNPPDWFFDPPFALRFLHLRQLPFHRTEYFLADGLRWSSHMYHATETGLPLSLGDGQAGKTYQAARTYRVDWNKSVLGPAFDGPNGVTRDGDRLWAQFTAASDATHFGTPNRPGTTRLLRDGEVIQVWKDGKVIEATLPPEEATYQLENTVATGADVSTQISSRWTFRSGHTSSTASLPLMAVRFTPKLDDHHHAPAGRFTIPVAVQRQPGAASSPVDTLTVDVSHDDGATWQPARVSGGKVHVDNPADGTVSLRATAIDRAGNKVEQTVIRAYLV
jgi:subtilisin family serine protease